MDTAQLIISAIAAVGSVASGAMLAWSIIMFRFNSRQQELSKNRLGQHKVLNGISEILRINQECEFKKVFRQFFASDFSHNIRNIYNGMQVSYKHSPIQEYIESHLVFDPQLGNILFERFDKIFRDIENIFDTELKSLCVLRSLFKLTYSDYYKLKDGVNEGLSKDFIIKQIHDIYYEQENELMSYEQFIEKLSIKCTAQSQTIYIQYYEVLEKLLLAMKLILEKLLTYGDSECLKDVKNQVKTSIDSSDIIKSCQEYFKPLEDVYSSFVAYCSQRELLLSKLNLNSNNKEEFK